VAAPDLLALVAQELPDDAMTLAALSRLYKAVTLAKALRLPAPDYLRLRALTGIDPFADVAATARFVEQARLVEQSGFSLDVLDALLRHRLSPAGGLDDAAAAELLGRLRTGLTEIAAAHAVAPDPTGARTRELFARQGARVVINDLDQAVAEETAAAIRASGAEAHAVGGSITDKDFPDRLVRTTVDTCGTLDIIVNNAGYTHDGVIHKMSDEQWYAMIDVHLTGPFRLLRAASRAPGTSCSARTASASRCWSIPPPRSARTTPRASPTSGWKPPSPRSWTARTPSPASMPPTRSRPTATGSA
jgi:hypothetical protein